MSAGRYDSGLMTRVVYFRGKTGNDQTAVWPEITYGNVRSTRNRLRPRRTTSGDSSIKIREARCAGRKDGSRGRLRDQHRYDSQQDDAGSGAAPFRVLLAEHIRCELPREGTDHDGGFVVPRAARDQDGN